MYAKKIEPTFYPEKSYDYKDINTEIMCHKIKKTTNALHVTKCIRKLVEWWSTILIKLRNKYLQLHYYFSTSMF